MSYQPNSTEELYIQRCAELLKPYGLDDLLRSTVHSLMVHAYEQGQAEGYSEGETATYNYMN